MEPKNSTVRYRIRGWRSAAAPPPDYKIVKVMMPTVAKEAGTASAYKNQRKHDFNKPFAVTVPEVGFLLWRHNLPFVHIVLRPRRFFCGEVDAV